MFINRWRMLAPVALLGLLGLGAGVISQAQDSPAQDRQRPGRIVQIGPDDGGRSAPVLPPPTDPGRADPTAQPALTDPAQPAAPKYWIGLVGGPVSPELRAHIDIPEDQGVMVREIVPNGPAAKAGLKLYDILLRANEIQIRDMSNLVELVRTEGERQGQLTLEVLRKGNRQAIWVKPELRPADAAVPPQPGFGEGFQGVPGRIPLLGELPEFRRFLEGFGGDAAPFEFRQFGPGVIVGGQGFGNLPNGVSVSVERQNDQPPRITVKRGDETWEVVGDDPESIQQLPEDIRPFVERMLQGGGMGRVQIGDFDADGDHDVMLNRRGLEDRPLRQRLEAIERQLQELLQQRTGGADRQPAEQPK
jgi:hypothetical protein